MIAVKFDPERPLGAPWTHEYSMYLHSAVVMALETMGWHPCPAIKAGWAAVEAVQALYQLDEPTVADAALTPEQLAAIKAAWQAGYANKTAYEMPLLDAEQEARDKYVADEIRAGRCPFGSLLPGQTFAHCPSGLPGCGCADEFELNPFMEKERDARDEEYGRYIDAGPLAWDDRPGGKGDE